MKLRVVVSLALSAVLSAMLVACGNGDKSATAVSQSDLLKYVPADSPYVFANSRPLPSELMDKLLLNAAVEFDQASKQIQASLDEQQQQQAESEKLNKLLKAVLAELEGKISADGLASLGFPVSGKSLLYGLGALPVGWTEIADRQKVEALLSRIEQRSGMTAEQKVHGAINYRRFDLDEIVGVLAVSDNYLIAAVLPAGSETELLPAVLGEQMPETSLADSGAFQQMLNANGYAGYGDGYIDTVQFTDMALGDSTGINAQIWQALAAEPLELTPECSQLAKGLARSIPRWSFGFTEASAQVYKVKSVIETSPRIAEYLQKIAAPVPGLGLDNAAMFTLGMGVSMPEMRDGMRAALLDIQQRGKGCEWIDEQELTQMMQAMDMAFNPMISGLKGFYLLLEDLQFNDYSMQPEAIDAQLLLAVNDPRGVFAMMGMLNHQFTQLQVPSDGTPVLLPLDGMAPTAPPTYVAIKDQALVFTTAADAVASSSNMFSAALATPAPVLAVSYNAAKLLNRAEKAAESVLQSMGDSPDAAEARQAYDSFRNSAQTYEQVSFLVNGTEKGLVIEQQVKLR